MFEEIIVEHFPNLVKNIADLRSSLSSKHNKWGKRGTQVSSQKQEGKDDEKFFKATKEDIIYTRHNDMNDANTSSGKNGVQKTVDQYL